MSMHACIDRLSGLQGVIMIDPETGDEAFNLEISSQDELGRKLVTPGAEERTSVPTESPIPVPRPSLRCDSAERELLKHHFSTDG
jgi:hypothetical protein